MHPKMDAIAPPRIKLPIVSKTHYLLCFSYILVVPETFKNWFWPSQFPLQLLSPPFGHQGILKLHQYSAILKVLENNSAL